MLQCSVQAIFKRVIGSRLEHSVANNNYLMNITDTDVRSDARVLADDIEQDQDTAASRSAGAAANKRRQADMLLKSLQVQKQPQSKRSANSSSRSIRKRPSWLHVPSTRLPLFLQNLILEVSTL